MSPDPDTVLYTLAGIHGPRGWGRSQDTSKVMDELANLGVDTSFALGDMDLAVCLYRTMMLNKGVPLSTITARLVAELGVHDVVLLPATDDRLETLVQISDGSWLPFQEYFVDRRHKDPVTALSFHGAPEARPAPGVVDAIESADTLIVAPSNPPLSIWPILAIDAIREAVERHTRRVAVSPLFGGQPLKGPADAVMLGVGLSGGSLGVLEAYEGLIDYLFVDDQDENDRNLGEGFGVTVVPGNTRLDVQDEGASFAAELLTIVAP